MDEQNTVVPEAVEATEVETTEAPAEEVATEAAPAAEEAAA